MIDKNVVKKLVEEWLQDKEYFLVSIEISPDDRIVVEIDHADGVWIEDCVALSKYIEDHLNRDEEDYELEVGSAGLGQPFKVPQQYINFIGKEVEVLDADGKKVKGILKAVEGNDFTVGGEVKVKGEGKKRKAENQLKFELGGAVLAAFKKLNKEIPEDRSKVTNSIVNNANFWKKVSKTKIYSVISTKESTYFEDIELFIKVIDGLASYSYDGQQLFEYEILKQKKLDKK